jgi:H+/Cl- antiporter ClcA
MHHRNLISIWFFIGVLVLVYGVIILAAALFNAPHEGREVVLEELRADIWWGALMTALGLLYTLKFRPKKKD